MPTAARSKWVLGVTGVLLLVVSIVMMVSSAPASKAQTVHPGLAPTQAGVHGHQREKTFTKLPSGSRKIIARLPQG